MTSPPILVLEMARKAAGYLDRRGLHDLLGHAAQNLHHAQRGDEGRQLAAGDQHAADAAQQAAEDHARDDADGIGRHARDADGGEQAVGILVDKDHDNRADGDHRGADGQVDAAGDDDKGHAQGHDAHARVVAQDVDPVLAPVGKPRAEGFVVKAQGHGLKNHHQGQHQARGKDGIGLPFAADLFKKGLPVRHLRHACLLLSPAFSRRLPAASFRVRSWFRP